MSIVKIYHVAKSRSLRPLWLLEELGIEYEVQKLSGPNGNFGGKPYKDIHPLNKVPALKHGDMVMHESIAIMQYIMNINGVGRLRPKPDEAEYGPYLQWLHYGESSLAPLVVNLMYQRYFFKPENRCENIELWSQEQIVKSLKTLEDQLEDHDYVLKSGFSAADISIGYTLLLLRLAKGKAQISPRIEMYWQMLISRPAWEKVSKI